MRLTPREPTQVAIKFWLDCLQVVTVILGIITASVTFISYRDAQVRYAAEQAARAKTQEQQSMAQLDATRRELERPYEDKKLELYLDAARVLAHLAATPDVDRELTEARFWELYWGELAFVESLTKNERTKDERSVERLMVNFCHVYFEPNRCTAEGGGASGVEKTRRTPTEKAAIEMARRASQEIRDRWEKIGRQ